MLTVRATLLTIVIVSLSCQSTQALVWTQELRNELSIRSFGGVRLCSAPENSSVIVSGLDAYRVQAAGTPVRFYTVTSRMTTNVISCDSSSVDGTYMYLLATMQEAIRWTDICENTLNLTVRLQSSITPALQQNLTPCSYDVHHTGLTQQQLTAWILITYTADWGPLWLNRTIQEPGDANTTATVMLSSASDPLSNATWYRVQATSEQLAMMSPSQRAQAMLTSISTAPGQNWWLLICSVLNATDNMRVTITGGRNDTIEMFMNCASLTQPTLVSGNPSNSSNSSNNAPSIETSTGGYWGPELQRLLTQQSFGDLTFCNATSIVGAIRVTATDDIVIERDSSTPATVVRGAVDLYLAPCFNGSTLALGDSALKVHLQREANWTSVCADSVNPTITVNYQSRTAFRFSPCPTATSITPAEKFAKLAWCILSLNSSGLELRWIRREVSSLIEPALASVSFSIFGGNNSTAIQWGNVQVNGLATGDNVDRLIQVFQLVNISYWPVVCQLLNASPDNYMTIEVRSNNRTSKLYANCSVDAPLSSTPPPSLTTTAAPPSSSTTRPTIASTIAPTTTTAPATTSTTSTSTTSTSTSTRPTTSTSTSTRPTTSTSTTSTTTPSTTPTMSTSTAPTIAPSSIAAGVTTAAEAGPVPQSQQEKDRLEIKRAEDNQQLGTQIAVVVFAVGTLVVLSTFGICKLVAPRAV